MNAARRLVGLARRVHRRLPMQRTARSSASSSLPDIARQPSVKPILPAADMAATIDFYRSLGFDVTAYDDAYAWVGHCGWELLHLAQAADLDPATNPAAAYIHVADADAWHVALAASVGGRPVGPVADMPWGMREFSFVDPSGNLVRLGHNL